MFASMNLREAEKAVVASLQEIYDRSEATNIASLAIEHVTGLPRREQVIRTDVTFTAEQESILNKVIERLQRHEPIQYIMNKAWFYGLELYVNPDVLIPRPETEELVDWVIKDVRMRGLDVFDKKPDEADETTRLKIMDVCTGSGCIALALKQIMPRAEVWGCDISDAALNIARRNGSELDIRVDFQFVNFLDPAQQKHLPTVDIIVSNPPYVPKKDQSSMRQNVLLHEPHLALFVDDNDPLVFYRALAAFGEKRLHNNGTIYVEIHENLGNAVQQVFEKEGYEVEIRKDMQGKERMIKATKY